MLRKDVGSQTEAHPPSFRQLERHARHLQTLLAMLVAGIAVLSTSVFFILQMNQLRQHSQRSGRHCAHIVQDYANEAGVDMQGLTSQLEKEMEVNGIVFLRLLGRKGKELLRLGDPDGSFFSGRYVHILPPSAYFQAIEIEVDDNPLFQQAAVFGIFILAAVLLTLAIYRWPLLALRRAIDELEITQAQLMHSDKLSAIGELTASLTHEINNPLCIILSRVKIMMAAAREGRAGKGLIQDLDMIDRHGTRIAEILHGLLAFARKANFEPVETDLNHVIGEVVGLVERPFTKQGIRIHCEFETSLPAVSASPPHIQQVFMNLFANARDAMPQGGAINLRTSRNGCYLIAEVEDTGTGIAKDLQGRLFEPFFTTKAVRKGTGLGLSVSYGIIKAHGGDIEVESEPGRGTLFRLTLPLEGRPS